MIRSDVCLKYYSTKRINNKQKTKLEEDGRGRQAALGQSIESTQVHFSMWIETEKRRKKKKEKHEKQKKTVLKIGNSPKKCQTFFHSSSFFFFFSGLSYANLQIPWYFTFGGFSFLSPVLFTCGSYSFVLDFTNSHSCTFEHGQTLLTFGDIADVHVAEMHIT